MKNLLICPHTLNYGGSQLSVHHWAKYLRNDYNIAILSSQKGGLSEKFESHYDVHYDSDEYPNITSFINKLKPDIIHACPGGGIDHAYIKEAARYAPVTQTVMCPRQAGNKKDVSMTIVPSEYSFSLQTNITNTKLIHHPFDVSEYNPGAYDRKHFNLPLDKKIILSLGNARKENTQFLALAKTLKHRNDVHFVIRADIKQPFWSNPQNLTIIKERVSEDEKMSLFNMADIFLYPTSNEAYGIVFLEAMSQRTPIISYSDTAMPETIRNAGMLAPLGNLKEISRLLTHLINNEAQKTRLGNNGLQLIQTRNDPITIAQEYKNMFESI